MGRQHLLNVPDQGSLDCRSNDYIVSMCPENPSFTSKSISFIIRFMFVSSIEIKTQKILFFTLGGKFSCFLSAHYDCFDSKKSVQITPTQFSTVLDWACPVWFWIEHQNANLCQLISNSWWTHRKLAQYRLPSTTFVSNNEYFCHGYTGVNRPDFWVPGDVFGYSEVFSSQKLYP